MTPHVPAMLRGVEAERFVERTRGFVEMGAPEDVARDVAVLLDAFPLLDVVEIAARTRVPADEIARMAATRTGS